MLVLVLNDCTQNYVSQEEKFFLIKFAHTYPGDFNSSLEVPLFVHKARRFYKSLIRKLFNGRLLHNQFA